MVTKRYTTAQASLQNKDAFQWDAYCPPVDPWGSILRGGGGAYFRGCIHGGWGAPSPREQNDTRL